jgi:DNA mismatch repair protein MutL
LRRWRSAIRGHVLARRTTAARPSDISRAAQTIEQRLQHVFGPVAAGTLVELAGDDGAAGAIRVRGFISRPGNDRPDRRMQLLFVNGRLLRSTLLAGVWTAGYSTFTLSGRQPYGVLFLDLAADAVDPNVHPTKSDVRSSKR